MSEPTCKSCPACDVARHICRKRPPKVIVGETSVVGDFNERTISRPESVWPYVDPEDDWCGEHPERKVAE